MDAMTPEVIEFRLGLARKCRAKTWIVRRNPMAFVAASASQNFPSVCRQWRQLRKLSQLDLALTADISQRHVSWLETGRSRPSREMVIRLSDALEIPLRERNVLLQSAGFSAVYNESRLDEPVMAPVLEALRHVLELAELTDTDHPVDANLLPVLPLELKVGELELSLFSVISTFGTPQDITTDELRIETFYPTDAKTEAFFRSMAG